MCNAGVNADAGAMLMRARVCDAMMHNLVKKYERRDRVNSAKRFVRRGYRYARSAKNRLNRLHIYEYILVLISKWR